MLSAILLFNILFILFFVTKEIIRKVFQIIYEQSLLNKNLLIAVYAGKIYYLSIQKSILKENGINNINEVIYKDIKSFGLIF